MSTTKIATASAPAMKGTKGAARKAAGVNIRSISLALPPQGNIVGARRITMIQVSSPPPKHREVTGAKKY
jgi:hypothetical protein